MGQLAEAGNEFTKAACGMKPIIVYVYPGDVIPKSVDYAWRFVASYRRFPPGMEHETVVVLNNTRLTQGVRFIFNYLQNVSYLEHDDSGWDIGAYQKASRTYPNADMMVFFGTSVYFKNPNWLEIMAGAFHQYGNGLYGCMGDGGNLTSHVYAHIRTTGFWLKPSLFNLYPKRINAAQFRYAFEHGRNCLTSWVRAQGLPTYVVTTRGVYPPKDWNYIPEGYRNGEESALLCADRMNPISERLYERNVMALAGAD